MAHINGLWHSTAMAATYESLHDPLQRLFGAVVMHDQVSDDPAIGRRGGMVWIGDNSIEIGAPVGDRSPVRNFVEKLGGGMHSIALEVDDAPATLSRLAGLGVQPAAFVSEDIFFTRPGDTAGLLLEFSATHTDDDPRWGYPVADLPQPPAVAVEQYAFVTAFATDPGVVAARVAEILGTPIVRADPGAGPGEIVAIVSLADALLLLFAVPAAGSSIELWGRDYGRTRFHGHGLRVADLDGALAALAARGVTVFRRLPAGPTPEHDLVLLDPSAVALPTFLCQHLLPEDPRLVAP